MNLTKSFFIIAVFILFGYYYFIKLFTNEVKGGEFFTKLKVDVENRTVARICFRHHFRHILLVIVFNYPLYDSIPLLKKFYEPIFPNLYFCGPKIKDNSTQIHPVEINRGIFGYECLAQAIRQNHMKGFRGYFYINDDVILNFWNLMSGKFDVDRLWSYRNGRESLEGKVPNNWYWWISPYGYSNVKKAIKKVELLAQKFVSYQKLMGNYLDNGNRSHYGYHGRSDVLYIPRKYALQFQELSNIFRTEQVFLEIAIPTMCRFLSVENEIGEIFGHYIPGDVRKNDSRVVDSRHFWVTYLRNPNLWFIHPFKLQHNFNNNRQLNLLLLQNILIKKSNELACLN